jgi:hypothetical protein
VQQPHHFKKMVGVQYPHHAYVKHVEFLYIGFFLDLVPNLDPTPQEGFPPMQDEHGDAMELNEWVHEGSKTVLQGECMH